MHRRPNVRSLTMTAEPTPELPIVTRGLVKRYGHILAVDHVDLTVGAGDVYGFLGPNGAGKTTAMGMLLGLLRPDAGSVLLFGRDPQHELPAALDGVAGFVETPHFYRYLSGRKNLELLAAFDGGDATRRIDEVLDVVELRQRAGDKVGAYSQGMRQRLGIAASLLRSPRLLILDEPTNGLDPAGIRDMRDLVTRLAEEGMTIFLSSHLLAEVEELCTRVAIIRTGAIVFEAIPGMGNLADRAAPSYRLRTTDPTRALAVCSRDERIRDVSLDGDEIVFSAAEEAVVGLSRALVEAGLGIAALTPQTATLESLFFELTEGAGDQRALEAVA